jgi:hypothetical protein
VYTDYKAVCVTPVDSHVFLLSSCVNILTDYKAVHATPVTFGWTVRFTLIMRNLFGSIICACGTEEHYLRICNIGQKDDNHAIFATLLVWVTSTAV